MTIQINTEGLVVPVSKSLCNLLTESLTQNIDVIVAITNSKATAITFNFRSPDYSAELGGYHPVEIHIERNGDTWRLCYITDFAYVGSGYCTELAKDADFDFQQGVFQSLVGIYPLHTAKSFYSIWESNFMEYATNLEVFDLSISHYD